MTNLLIKGFREFGKICVKYPPVIILLVTVGLIFTMFASAINVSNTQKAERQRQLTNQPPVEYIQVVTTNYVRVIKK